MFRRLGNSNIVKKQEKWIMVKKHSLSKYLWCTAAAGTLELAIPVAHADDMVRTNVNADATVTTAPTLVSGTVESYMVDRTGYVTAIKVKDSAGASQWIRFPANRASTIYGTYPTGGPIDVWVVPGRWKGQWTAVGTGRDTPDVWWRVIDTTDADWLNAEPYIETGAREVTVSGTLAGKVLNDEGEIVALKLKTPNGMALVRVPPQVRQIAPGYKGSEGVTPLFRGADVTVVGTPEAPRKGGLMAYNSYIAGNAFSVNGQNVGAIGFQAQ